MSMNPLVAFIRTHAYLVTGRLHFPRNRVGDTIRMPDGRDYEIFREAVVDPAHQQPEKPGAVFIPRFHVAGMSSAANKRFSLLPIPFFVGFPGFRSKLWLVNPDNGDFSALYEWDTVRDAENYSRSIAARFMARRSVPGTVTFRVIPRPEWEAMRLAWEG